MHIEFTRINTTPTILRKKIEDLRETRATLLHATALIMSNRRPHRISRERQIESEPDAPQFLTCQINLRSSVGPS